MLHSNPHSSHGFTLTLGIAILVFAGCAKEESLGPELGSLFGDLELTAPFGHDMPNGVHFAQDEGVQFSGEFNLPVAYTLSLTGQSSGASYSYQGQGENVADVLWYGDCDDVFFRQNEWVHCLLEFQDFPDDFQLDSVFVWEQPDLSSRGLLLASFEESQATYSLSSGEFTQSLDVLSEATDAVEGSAYMSGVGSGAAAWFGALRISLSPLAFGGLDPEKTHLNMHLRSNYVGSATVVKVFEDSDGDGLITAGMDEVYTTKLTLNADGNWHRRSVLWSDLELDLSGNNVSIDGQIDMDKIGRIDCTVSQTGTAEGTFGMDIDYVILTQDDPF
jgi:hypothetical protein